MKNPVSSKILTFRNNGKKRVMTLNEQESKTDTQFKDDCDINYIVKKFNPSIHLAKTRGVYADTSEIPDLLTASMTVLKAEQDFMSLPADARLRFNNNPQEMINFLQNPNNYEEAVKLKLLIPREAPMQNDKLNDEKQSKPSPKKAKNQDSSNSDAE